MLKKIIGIKNVGRFRNSAATPNPQLAKHTFIAGANGFGKTTICAVLRSVATGDPSLLLGRKTLGAVESISVELLLSAGNAKFDGQVWSTTEPNIAIFDGAFVADNVHSGEVVDIDQKRNLYRVIIGGAGVGLARQEAELAAQSRAKTSEISAKSKEIQPYCLAGMSVENFVKLQAEPNIDQAILDQENIVKSCKEAAAVSARAPIAPVPFPDFPEGFRELMVKSLDGISAETERLVAEHLAAHAMTAEESGWLATGVEHAKDTCPFCGQGINGLPLIEAYRSIFSERYRALVAEIQTMRERVLGLFGDATVGRLDTLAEQNIAAVDFWHQHCKIAAPALAFPAELRETLRHLGNEALALLDRKALAPLETAFIPEAFSDASLQHAEAVHQVRALNASIAAANELIAGKKREVAGTDLKSAEHELALRRAKRSRHAEPAATLCRDYQTLSAEKQRLEAMKTTVRGKLDEHTEAVMEPYERRINALLDAFNAGFGITKTSHSYPGGVATSSYQLVINNVAVDLGDGKTSNDRPSFKNTLSSGDRATLALAFFLVHLERDQDLAGKIVVFDDPFNSQDAFRRRQTVHEIVKISKACGQVIVLSHDATFLKQIWDKAPDDQRTALAIVDQRSLGSKLLPLSLEKATQGRTATDIDDLQTFISTGAGGLVDVIRKMRVVLETYCRMAYASSFETDDNLGEIVKKIRDGGANHPAAVLYDELDQINDYTVQYHHGEDTTDATPDSIDTTELTGYVRRTLRVANALQS